MLFIALLGLTDSASIVQQNQNVSKTNSNLFITREVMLSGDPVFEILKEDTYGDPEDKLISEIMTYGLSVTFSQSEYLISVFTSVC